MSDGALMKKQGRITLNINKLQLYHSLFIGGLPGRNAEDAAEQDLDLCAANATAAKRTALQPASPDPADCAETTYPLPTQTAD